MLSRISLIGALVGMIDGGSSECDRKRTRERRRLCVRTRQPGRRWSESPKTVCPKNFYCYQTFLVKRGWVLRWEGHSRLYSSYNALKDRFKKMQVYAGGSLADFWFSKRGVGGASLARCSGESMRPLLFPIRCTVPVLGRSPSDLAPTAGAHWLLRRPDPSKGNRLLARGVAWSASISIS